MRYRNYDKLTKEQKQMIKNIYNEAFPKSERFPFYILKKCNKGLNVHLNAIINTETDEIIGMYFDVNYNNIKYIMYLAIKKEFQNQGYGSEVLRDICVNTSDNVVLCIEKPNSDKKDIKDRRKNLVRKLVNN